MDNDDLTYINFNPDAKKVELNSNTFFLWKDSTEEIRKYLSVYEL